MVRRRAGGLDQFTQTLIHGLSTADVLGADETGIGVEGTLAWVHAARTDTLTYYSVSTRRGVEVTNEAAVLPALSPDTVVVSDFLAPYWRFDVVHAVCGTHLGRELVAAAEPSLLATYRRRYDELIEVGWAANPDHRPGQRGKRRRPKHVNLLDRLDTHRDEVLRYASDLRVPFTNNGSEQDIRPLKIRMKVAGCLRTMTGAQAFCRAAPLPVHRTQARPTRLRRHAHAPRRHPPDARHHRLKGLR